MARKKASDPQDAGARRAVVDQIFDQTVKRAEYLNAKAGRPVGSPEIFLLPVPSLSLRFMFQNTGIMLGRGYHLLGPQGSYKSTMLAQIVYWHYLGGGFGFCQETENKEADEMSSAIQLHAENAYRIEPCEDVERWQESTTDLAMGLVKSFSEADGVGPTVPVAFGVDSIGVVAGCDEELPGEFDADAVEFDELGCGCSDQCFDLPVECLDLFIETLPAAGQVA